MSASSAASSSLVWRIAGWTSLGLLTLWLGFVAVIVTVVGVPYFVLEEVVRPDHGLHDLYRPAGLVGLATGFLGTGLMIVLLVRSADRTRASTCHRINLCTAISDSCTKLHQL